jgi:DNA-binding transcriptional ArsR family regulator
MSSKSFASDRCAQYLKAVGAAERLRIISCLRDGPKNENVSEISDELDVEVVKVSHHLQVLRHAGVVSDRKEGRFVIYTLSPEIYSKATGKQSSDHLDFGCCRLELPH